MTALLAPERPPATPPEEAPVPTGTPLLRSWLRALPRPADLAALMGAAGEWLGHASLEPALVVLGREPAAGPLPVADVLGVRPSFAGIYAAAAAVQAGATGLLSGLASAGRWAGLAGLAGAFGIDSVLTTATCVRAVSHVGAHYGFAVRSDDERTEVLAIVATTLGGPTLAGDRRQLAGLVIMRLSVYRGPTELVRLVPAVGPVVDAVLGAVVGARLLARMVDDADRHYRARYLAERDLAT